MNYFYLWAGRFVPPFLLLAVSVVHAGDDDAWQEETGNMETVTVTATRNETSAHEVSVAISTVKQEQVLIENPDVISEMLRGLPGTYFQQTTPGQGIPIIRGLKGSQVLHLLDGMRINNAFFRDAPNQYLGLVDPFSVSKVEVVRGAAGSLYGADAMGGVVQFLTPEIIHEGTDWQRDGQIYGSWNSADDGLAFHAQAGGGNSRQGFSVGASWADHSNRRAGNGETISPSGYRTEAANLKWSTITSDTSDLTLSAQVLEQPSTPRVDELVAGFGQDSPASEQFAFQPNRRSFLHARYRSESQLKWLDRYQLNLARQQINDDRLTQDAGSSRVRTEQNRSTLDGITLQLDSSPATLDSLTWGFEYYTDSVDSTRQDTDQQTSVSSDVRSRFPDGSSMDSLAFYASAQWMPASRWTLGAGLRHSRFDIFLPGADGSMDTRLSPDDTTADFRFSYALSPAVNLVGNIGRGFRPPNIFDLGTLGNRPGNRFNLANPDLQPESVLSYDLGFKTRSGNWQSELFVFALDYRDKITSVATGDLTETGRIIVRSQNLAEAFLYGLEAGFRWSAREELSVYGSLNYTRGEETSSGTESPADRIPPLNGKLGLLWKANDKLDFDVYSLFAARQDRLSDRDIGDPRINPEGTAGWATLNASLKWQISERLEAGLRLENLTDRHYREHGSGIDAPGINIGAWANMQF